LGVGLPVCILEELIYSRVYLARRPRAGGDPENRGNDQECSGFPPAREWRSRELPYVSSGIWWIR